MEEQEKPFRDLQQAERLEKLKRHLKLTHIKRPNSSQALSSPHMSISSISSIHGDNPLSDFSFCTTSGTASRAGSVILASSANFRKKISKNLKTGIKIGPTTSSVFDQSLNSQKLDEDRVMMPPPPAINNPKLHSSVITEQKGQANNLPPKTSISQSYENQNCNIHSLREAPQSDCKITVENEPPNEVSRNKDTSKQYGRVFRNWIVRLNDHGQIIIKGRLESGEQARSKAVKRRLSASTVLSVLNHKYHLVGDIHDTREELPEYVRGKFYNGFPTDWETVRQIWQCYVASGFSLQFRWPRPMADSDDDLRSDITDLTVSGLKNVRTKPTSFVSIPHHCQTAGEIDTSSRKRESRSQREKRLKDSDISTIYSTVNEESDTQAKISTLETSCRNAAERTTAKPGNHVATQTEPASRNIQPKETGSLKCGNTVPRWKVDVIVDNLLNKNCSKAYIEKIIRAIDCVNELFTMPATNHVETATNEGMSLNYNSHSQSNLTSSKVYSETEKAQTFKNVDSSRLQHSRQAIPLRSDSFSVDDSEESEEEPRSDHKTFVCEQSLKNNPASHILMKSQQSRNSALEIKNFTNYSDVNRERNGSTPVNLITKFDTRHQKNKENQVTTPMLPREETLKKSSQMERHKRKAIFDSTDSDTEARVSSKARTGSVKNISIVTTSARRTVGSKHQPVASEKMYNRVVEGVSGACYDSDVSIVDTSAAPSMKSRILSIEKISHNLSERNQQREPLNLNFSLTTNENGNHSQAISSVPKRGGNLSNQKLPGSLSGHLVEQCTVQLNKITVDQHNHNRSNCTPTKTEETATGRRNNKIDTSRRMNEPPESDSENLSIRMSSRGRRILPPLDYWNGERVTLKGRELVYSPGTCCPVSLSANSTILKQSLLSPNATAVSDLAAAKSFESTNRNVRHNGGIFSEISINHNEEGEDTATSNRRVTRTSLRKNMQTDVKKNRKAKTVNENSDSSSEDGKLNVVRRRKRRKIDWRTKNIST